MEKNIILILIIVFAFTNLKAQYLDQGNFVIGTTIGLSANSSRIIQNTGGSKNEGQGPNSAQFSVAPKIGYFAINNLAVGIGLDYTFSQIDQPNEDVIKDSDLLFGPFARYFIPLGSEDMAFFLEATFGFGSSSDNQELAGVVQRINSNILSIGVGPGFTVISDSGVGISASVKYNYARSNFDTILNGIDQQTITKTNAFDFSIGFQYYFGGFAGVGTTIPPTDSRY